MTDHLDQAHEYILRALHPVDSLSGLMDLAAAVSRIFDHLEAQQASPQPTTAPPAAQQGDNGHRDGGEAVQAAMAVLCDMGADSGGWHSWRCFDRELYPEPCDCTKQATRAAIAAAEPRIRAKIADEIERHYLGADFGRNPTTGADSHDAHLHAAYDEALHLAARIARQEQP